MYPVTGRIPTRSFKVIMTELSLSSCEWLSEHRAVFSGHPGKAHFWPLQSQERGDFRKQNGSNSTLVCPIHSELPVSLP